ncbi:MAG TPA: class IV adenylate cyclase [Candidatus Polarisedimenticolaceae bacterium]|nr:class IV adenylate cyclase [Candidatus Polarisedimenticolaceae bacterium]
MGMSRRETEIKLAFPSAEDARRALIAAGAVTDRPREFEDNVLYDFEDRRLFHKGRLLRLRRVGADALVTFKGPVEGESRHKVREESEVRVDDGDEVARILEGVGFRPCYRYQKYRSTFTLPGVHAALDETALGTFVELEGDPDAIDRAASALGRGTRDYLKETYRELQERHAAATGIPAGDLLYPRDTP